MEIGVEVKKALPLAALAVLAVVPITSPAQEASAEQIDEIQVTAQRRVSGITQAPLAVTAITSEQMNVRGMIDYGSYLRTVPGAAMQDTSAVGGEIKFRGIGTGQNAQLSPTTAVYFGEVPVVHTGRNVNSSYNFRLVDLERIEVLRGPQGQLYGANSLGGAIRNIPNEPEHDAHHAAFSVGGSSLSGGGSGNSLEGIINAPILDGRAAVRVVGYSAEDAGWYDNTFRGGPTLGSLPVPPPPGPGSLLPLIFGLQPLAPGYSAPSLNHVDDVNETSVQGVRLMYSWRPSERTDVLFTFANESKETQGPTFAQFANPLVFPPSVAPPPMDYREYEFYEASNAGMSDEIDLFSLDIGHEADFATFRSITSYWERTENLDISLSIVSFPVTGQPHTFPQISKRSDNPSVFTQEFRLVSPDDNRFDWLIGAFYQEIDQDHRVLAIDQSGLDLRFYHQTALSIVTGGMVPPPTTTTLADNRANYKDTQIAVFGELGFDFTETLHAALAFRWFNVEQDFRSESFGFQFGFAQGTQSGENDESVFTPRLQVDWHPTDSQTYYVSASEGYRTGIINRDIPQLDCGAELAAAGYPDGLPPTDADTVLNYEVGAKYGSRDGRFRISAAAYTADWSDMQLNFPLSAFSPVPALSFCAYDGVANVAEATSTGFELEFSALITENLRADFAASWTDAQFDTTIPELNISDGDEIPFTPDLTAYVGLQLDFDLNGKPGYARLDWQYVGEKAPLTLDFPQFQYPDGVPFDIGKFDQLDLRVGFDLTEQLSVEAFVRNATDEFGITSTSTTGGLGYPFVITIPPRSIGAQMTFTMN